MLVTIPPDYRPKEDEEFMNAFQLEYFRQKLLRWRHELLREADGVRDAVMAAIAPFLDRAAPARQG